MHCYRNEQPVQTLHFYLFLHHICWRLVCCFYLHIFLCSFLFEACWAGGSVNSIPIVEWRCGSIFGEQTPHCFHSSLSFIFGLSNCWHTHLTYWWCRIGQHVPEPKKFCWKGNEQGGSKPVSLSSFSLILAEECSNGTEQASRKNYKRKRSKNLQFYLPNDHPHDYSRVLTTYSNNQTRIWTDITLNLWRLFS